MSVSLYTAVVPTWLQILGSVAGLIDKAEAHCESVALPPAALIQASLAESMKPFAFQIVCTAAHSGGTLEGLRRGVYSPDLTPPPQDFAGLRKKIAAARQILEGVSESEMDGFTGKPLKFKMGDFEMDFIAEQYLFSFAQPNFFFHATTAYDILRWKGVEIGKMDFLGALRKL